MAVSSSNDHAPPHVLVIPFPAQGHMIPLLDLTHNLASIGNITITVLTTPKNQSLINPLLSSHSSIIHPLILPFPSHPSIPHGIENVKDMPNSMRIIVLSFAKLYDDLIQWFNSHPSPPQFIISDMSCGWTQHLASELHIRRLVFSPSGAFAFATMCFLWKELPPRRGENDVVVYHKIPNSPKYPWWQVSPLFRSYVPGDPDSERIKDWLIGNSESWGLIVNSFNDFEKPYLDYFRMELGPDRVWAVGPLIPGDDSFASKRGGSSSVSVNDVVSWLDQKEDRKVVHVCFGSQAILKKDQTEAIASALVKSGVHFIWSIKESSNENQDEDLGLQKGLVIRGWAPQVLILRHRAVGAFLTHCGWNSVLESVMAGVPMLAWPMTADQFVNATLLVEEFQVAKKVCGGEKSVPDSDELSRVLAESVNGKGEETWKVMKKLQAAALEAVSEGGSSDKDLRCLTEQLRSPFR